MEKKEGTPKKEIGFQGSGLQRKRKFPGKERNSRSQFIHPSALPAHFFDGLASGMFKKSQRGFRGEFIVSFKEMKETPFWSIDLGSLARSAYEK